MTRRILIVFLSLFFIGSAHAQSRLTPVPGVPVLQGDVIGAQTIYLSSLGNVGPSLSLIGRAAGSLHDVFQTAGGTLCSAPMPQPTLMQVTGGTTLAPGAWTTPGNAFDGNISQTALAGAYITSSVGLNNYIGKDYGTPVTISQAVIYAPVDDWLRGDEPVAGVQIEVSYSDDNVNFSVVTNNTFVNSWGAVGRIYTVNFMPTTHEWWRFGVAGNGSSRIKINELQFWGPAPYSRGIVWNGTADVSDHDIPACASTAGPIDCPVGCEYLGLVQIDQTAAGQVSCVMSYGLNRGCGVWNAQNQVDFLLRSGDSRPAITTSPPCHSGSSCFVYTPAGEPEYLFGPTEGNSLIRLRVISGLPGPTVHVKYKQVYFINGVGAYWWGIGINGSNFPCSTWLSANFDSSTQGGASQDAECVVGPFVGSMTFNAIEGQSGNVSAFWGENNMVLQATVKY